MRIYLVASTYEYEGTTIAGVFSTEAKAEAFIIEQRDLCFKFMKDQKKTDYSTQLKTPKCNGEKMEVLKYKINDIDHYEMNFNNLTFEKKHNRIK